MIVIREMGRETLMKQFCCKSHWEPCEQGSQLAWKSRIRKLGAFQRLLWGSQLVFNFAVSKIGNPVDRVPNSLGMHQCVTPLKIQGSTNDPLVYLFAYSFRLPSDL